MFDERKNLILVQAVETYPCLYDHSREDYTKRDVCEKAWTNIANKVGYPVYNCKEKWKNLRTAFSRSIKKLPAENCVYANGKKYYLKDSMTFILPYLKSYEKKCLSYSKNENINFNCTSEIRTDKDTERVPCNGFRVNISEDGNLPSTKNEIENFNSISEIITNNIPHCVDSNVEMSEDQDNIKFVQEIEKYPCIYDHSNIDYSKRNSCRNAWINVAKEVNDTVPNCKVKWKNLRTALARSNKNKKKTNYYLKDSMKFVLPSLKNHFSVPESITCDGTNEDTNNSFDSDSFEEDTNKTTPIKIPKIVNQNNSFASISSIKDDTNSVERIRNFKTSNRNNSFVANESDVCFMKSLLPDISNMNCYQKRLFKRRVLEIIDTILCDASTTSTASSQSTISNMSKHTILKLDFETKIQNIKKEKVEQ